MRVAMIVNSFPPRVGGLEQHVENLSQGLADLGHDVSVVTLDKVPGFRLHKGVRVFTGKAHLPIADIISFPAWGTTTRLTKFLKENGIEVVSTHTRFFPMSFVGLKAARRAGIPVIHTEHGSDFVASGSQFVRLASRLVDHTFGRVVLGMATNVLGVSEEAAGFVRRLSGRTASVFYNAIPRLERPQTLHHDTSHLVFVGRVVPGKGWDSFLDSVAKLRDEGYEVSGSLLGDGVDLDRARERARTLGIDQLVSIPGRVSAESVRAELSGATLVNPTVLSEGFQTTLLEAVAEGGSIVTFPVPGAQQLVAEGFPVLITAKKSVSDLVAALKVLLQNPREPVSVDEVARWTWDTRAKQYASILQDVIQRSSSES